MGTVSPEIGQITERFEFPKQTYAPPRPSCDKTSSNYELLSNEHTYPVPFTDQALQNSSTSSIPSKETESINYKALAYQTAKLTFGFGVGTLITYLVNPAAGVAVAIATHGGVSIATRIALTLDAKFFRHQDAEVPYDNDDGLQYFDALEEQPSELDKQLSQNIRTEIIASVVFGVFGYAVKGTPALNSALMVTGTLGGSKLAHIVHYNVMKWFDVNPKSLTYALTGEPIKFVGGLAGGTFGNSVADSIKQWWHTSVTLAPEPPLKASDEEVKYRQRMDEFGAMRDKILQRDQTSKSSYDSKGLETRSLPELPIVDCEENPTFFYQNGTRYVLGTNNSPLKISDSESMACKYPFGNVHPFFPADECYQQVQCSSSGFGIKLNINNSQCLPNNGHSQFCHYTSHTCYNIYTQSWNLTCNRAYDFLSLDFSHSPTCLEGIRATEAGTLPFCKLTDIEPNEFPKVTCNEYQQVFEYQNITLGFRASYSDSNAYLSSNADIRVCKPYVHQSNNYFGSPHAHCFQQVTCTNYVDGYGIRFNKNITGCGGATSCGGDIPQFHCLLEPSDSLPCEVEPNPIKISYESTILPTTQYQSSPASSSTQQTSSHDTASINTQTESSSVFVEPTPPSTTSAQQTSSQDATSINTQTKSSSMPIEPTPPAVSSTLPAASKTTSTVHSQSLSSPSFIDPTLTITSHTPLTVTLTDAATRIDTSVVSQLLTSLPSNVSATITQLLSQATSVTSTPVKTATQDGGTVFTGGTLIIICVAGISFFILVACGAIVGIFSYKLRNRSKGTNLSNANLRSDLSLRGAQFNPLYFRPESVTGDYNAANRYHPGQSSLSYEHIQPQVANPSQSQRSPNPSNTTRMGWNDEDMQEPQQSRLHRNEPPVEFNIAFSSSVPPPVPFDYLVPLRHEDRQSVAGIQSQEGALQPESTYLGYLRVLPPAQPQAIANEHPCTSLNIAYGAISSEQTSTGDPESFPNGSSASRFATENISSIDNPIYHITTSSNTLPSPIARPPYTESEIHAHRTGSVSSLATSDDGSYIPPSEFRDPNAKQEQSGQYSFYSTQQIPPSAAPAQVPRSSTLPPSLENEYAKVRYLAASNIMSSNYDQLLSTPDDQLPPLAIDFKREVLRIKTEKLKRRGERAQTN
ncbi:hypothetical protein D5018_09105 [Parashewanella curva]|uniref:Uncharacterized protein n=1 Tax=Parashewanella curva TaxID=2338552 RepID=A0A3L8PZ49_9GAMM|nr:hypothetical protein [Parashewanella curva]RLV60059.1 hypothetical protein D5018_09105 [Parashewanella curva]